MALAAIPSINKDIKNRKTMRGTLIFIISIFITNSELYSVLLQVYITIALYDVFSSSIFEQRLHTILILWAILIRAFESSSWPDVFKTVLNLLANGIQMPIEVEFNRCSLYTRVYRKSLKSLSMDQS